MAYKRYSAEELSFYESIADEALARISDGESLTSISDSYGLKRQSLSYYLVKHGGLVRKRRKYLDTNKITKIVLQESYELYSTGEYTITKIAEKFNVNRKKLSKMLKEEYKIEVRRDGKKPINSFFFHNADNHEKAYWLGIMYSDGYTDGDRAFELCLKDREHVEKFKSALQSTHSVSRKVANQNGKQFVSWRISIDDKQIVSDLCSLGCINNKSLVVQLPVFEEPLMSSFLRGFFDGDGSLRIAKDNYIKADITSGSELILHQISWYLRGRIGVHSTITDDKRSDTTKYLNFSSTEGALQFLDYVYQYSEESTRLNRKYQIYTQFKLPSLLKATEE